MADCIYATVVDLRVAVTCRSSSKSGPRSIISSIGGEHFTSQSADFSLQPTRE